MSRRFEFVIVGGGVFGCGLAWELARQGASVALLEAQTIASGASGGPGKRGVRANSRHEHELPLAHLANEIWPSLAEDLGTDIGYERIGGLELFESPAARARATAQAERQKRLGIPTRLIDVDELRELQPGLSEQIIGAVYCPDDGVVDHSATTLALANAARRAGAAVFEETQALWLDGVGGHTTAIAVANEHIEIARAVALLANCGVRDVLGSIGIENVIGRVFPQVLPTEPAPSITVRRLVGHLERRAIVKQLPDASLMITGGWLGRWNEQTQRGETVADHVEGNYAEACEVLPALRHVAVREAFADRPESVGPELLPIIDRVGYLANTIVGTGWSGHGFAIAPAVSRLLASWLLGGDKPPELEPFFWRS